MPAVVLGESQMRMLSEMTESNNNAIFSMLIFTSLCYGLFFCALSAMCFMPALGARGGDTEGMLERPPKDMNVSGLDEMWKKQFVRKVYSILGIQIFLTVVISSAMMLLGGEQLVLWVYGQGAWITWVTLFGSMANLVALMCYRQKSPHNLILLFTFTVLESMLIGFICASYAAAGLGAIVIEAFAITSVIFIGLTLFTMQSKIDFNFLGPMLFVSLLVLIVWGMFANFFFTSFVFNQVYALAGVIIFSLYVVYDTHQIMNNLSYDEYIAGAINLYLDFINLFLFMLRLLSGGQRS